jgi:hypothetical protein
VSSRNLSWMSTTILHEQMDIKISLALCGMHEAIVPPAERIVQLLKPYKYNVLYIIRNHIHSDLKLKYAIEEEPSTL